MEARIMGMAAYDNRIILRQPPSLQWMNLGTKPKRTPKAFKPTAIVASSASSLAKDRTVGGPMLRPQHEEHDQVRRDDDNNNKSENKWKKKKRVFFLDVNPLCYNGSTPSLHSFAQWISRFFSEVSLTDPVVAVIDGERANNYRRQLLPSYKAHRRSFSHRVPGSGGSTRTPVTRSHQLVSDILTKCNVPVVKIADHEADDVIATLVEQAQQKGYHVVVASPDKDFKQLICEDVQLVIPLPELGRWSFYTLKHYMAQYSCDPQSDLSLRCIMGDEVDGVPGIQQLVPGFGRKTALKLLKKHGSLENLLNAAAVRTVGRPYVQDALAKYASYLRKNYEVLSLRRDVNVHLHEEWLYARETQNDSESLSNFLDLLQRTRNSNQQNRAYSNG